MRFLCQTLKNGTDQGNERCSRSAEVRLGDALSSKKVAIMVEC